MSHPLGSVGEMKTCTIEGCEKRYYARGWCQMHYRRWKVHGDTDTRLSWTGRKLNEPYICSVEGCESEVSTKAAKGLCMTHYSRLRHHGSVEERPPLPSRDERFWSKVTRADGCWLWEGTLNPAGYGVFNLGSRTGNRTVLAHRFAYEQLVGPITEESLDHLCYVRRCCNPEHLEPVPLLENQRRAVERRHAMAGSL